MRSCEIPAQRGTALIFIFSKDVGGGEFYQLYRYDHATAAVTLLTDGKSRNTDEHWSSKRKISSPRQLDATTGNDTDIWLGGARASRQPPN